MKNIVIYSSKTGFTKKYAELIAERLNCKALPLKLALKEDLTNYRVIYGGWIFGGKIIGLDKITPHYVFAVGSTPIDIISIDKIKELNNLQDVTYMPGGFEFKKHNFFIRTMLKVLKKSVAKKENKTPEDEYMAKHLGETFSLFDEKYIEPLLIKIK